MSTRIPVSIGELWDKFTILLIKKERIIDIKKQAQVKTEIKYLQECMNTYAYQEDKLFLMLKNVNEKLWDIEDKLRIKESEKTFDNEFITLARAVYYTNDERAEIKRDINTLYNSMIYEVKEYVEYKV
jgi:hypothetical protein